MKHSFALAASVVALVSLMSCSSSTSPGASTSLKDSLAGTWRVHEVAVSVPYLGGTSSTSTYDFTTRFEPVDDTLVLATSSDSSVAWHFAHMPYRVDPTKRTIVIPFSTVSGKIISGDSILMTGTYVGGGLRTDFTQYYSK